MAAIAEYQVMPKMSLPITVVKNPKGIFPESQ